MNSLLLSAIHHAVCIKINSPLAAINVLEVEKSLLAPNRLRVVFERNENCELDTIYIDKDKLPQPFIHRSQNIGNYISSKLLNCHRFKNLPSVYIQLESNPNQLYSNAVKKLIALSLLSWQELAKYLYPALFKGLPDTYMGFDTPLETKEIYEVNKQLEQDQYIKLLTIFDIKVPVAQELFFYKRAIELTGAIVKISSNNEILIHNDFKDSWYMFNIKDRDTLATRFVKELLYAHSPRSSTKMVV